MKVEVNGIQVNYELSGKADGSVVMLSHSLCTGLQMWDPQMPALAQDYRVLRYDTRGHGGSGAPQNAYSLEQLGEDAIGLLDKLGIDTVHWVGISMGGMIGQNLALDHAHRLNSLVLCDTTAIMPEDAQPVWQQRIDTAKSQGMASLVPETLERWFTPPYLSKNPPQVQHIREQILTTPVAGFVGCSEAIRRLNYIDRLARIQLPTLIIVGEDEPGTPVSASEAIHERIAGSVLEILPAARHLCNIEQTEAFDNVLLPFLQHHDNQ
jgi:3-oxoadipate enol-lactonase